MFKTKAIHHTIWVLLLGAGMILTGCSDDTEISPEDHGAYSVTAYSAGEESFGVSYNYENQVFCYENDGCETSGTGFSSWTLPDGGDVGLMGSDAEREAIGFIIEVNITSGEGYLEVEGFNIDMETFELSDEEVILTTDVYSEDETITVSWGDTEGFEENDDR